jgi:hypothetical protein
VLELKSDPSKKLFEETDPCPDGYFGTEDDDYGDPRLKYGSPAIDAVDNTATGLAGITTDKDGNPQRMYIYQ